jgi:hypothetical protein
MTRWPGRGFKHMTQNILHVYTECPEGSIIAIAKRDAVNLMDLEAMNGLAWCPWCEAQDRIDNPP